MLRLLVCLDLLMMSSGCMLTHRVVPQSPEISDSVVAQRVTIPADTRINPSDTVLKSHEAFKASPDAPPVLEPGIFSLIDAIAYAKRNNPRLRSARAAIERAQGQEQVAFSPFLPHVDLLSQMGSTSNNQGPGSPGATGFLIGTGDGAHQYIQVETQLQWTLYDFGRTRSHFRQAVARERLTELQLVRVEQTIEFDVTAAYMNVLLARAYARVQEEAIQRAEAILHDAKARRKGGVADRDDVLRAEVQLSESREALVNAREAEFAAMSRLNYVLGRNAGLPLQVIDLETRPRTHATLAEYLDAAASSRPEIGVARQAVAAAQAGREARDADFLPRIFTRASAGRVEGNDIRTGWQQGVGLHMNVPLYSGGRRLGELQSALADVSAAVADAQLILDSISLEVNLAYRGMTAAAERIDLSRVAVVQAEENLRLVRVKYRNGTATPTDIVDAETSLTRSQNRYYSAIYSYTVALARLAYSMGRPQGETLNRAIDPEELPNPRPVPKANLPENEAIVPVAATNEAEVGPVWRRTNP